VWFDKARDGGATPGKAHYLINSIWALAGFTLPSGSYLRPRNFDWLDLRLDNLKPITPRPTS
jgi:hypothetical protein